MDVSHLWDSRSPKLWANALERYWCFVSDANLGVEQEMDSLDTAAIEGMDADEWYDFLLNKYYRWKFTDSLLYTQNSRHLERADRKELCELKKELHNFKDDLFTFDKTDIRRGLFIARRDGDGQTKIGLGTAAASGLLGVLFPEYFGTVDQFVVTALRDVEAFKKNPILSAKLQRMNPKSLTRNNGVVLIQVLRDKAANLNSIFKTDTWAPRKLDTILWTFGNRTKKLICHR